MPRRTPLARALCAAITLLLAAHQALAADPQPYTVKIAPTGEAGLDAALAGSSLLVSLRTKAPAGPFALVSRARQDQARLTTALESYGYYQATLATRIAGRDLNDAGLPDAIAALPAKPPAPVVITATRGPRFTLRHVSLAGTVPAIGRAALKLAPGAPAIASDVLAAGDRVLAALREDGYALAKVDPPEAIEIPAAHALDVSFRVDAGPRVDLGPISFSGLKRMHEAFLRRRLLLRPGELYQPSKIEAARQDLASLGVFAGVQAKAGPGLDADGTIPIDFGLQERKLRTVTANAAYSTDLGGSVGVTWSHRDLFGNAEQLNLGATATGLGGTSTTGLGYDVTAQLLKPDFLHRDQTLEFDLTALKQELIAYSQTAEIAGVSLTRKLSKQWTATIGLTGTEETILQELVTREYTLIGVPLTALYDGTGLANPLVDPLHGIRATVSATPTESLSGHDSTFTVLQANASTYVDVADLGLTRPGRTVFAFRALVGSVQGAGQFQLPPDQRFYGGGTATVRGFKYQSIWPLFTDTQPEGGTSIDAGTIELRQRVFGPVGMVAFVDAGQVAASSAPFQGTLREGVGVGARYYTPIGPIRVDVGVPLNKPPGGDSFELYIGLGQAF